MSFYRVCGFCFPPCPLPLSLSRSADAVGGRRRGKSTPKKMRDYSRASVSRTDVQMPILGCFCFQFAVAGVPCPSIVFVVSVSLLVLFRSACLALLPRSAAGAEARARPRTCRITVVLPFPGWTFRCPSWVVLVFRFLLLRFLVLMIVFVVSVSLLVLFRSACLALLPRSAAGAEARACPRKCRITVVLPFPGWTFRCPSWVVLVSRSLLLRFLVLIIVFVVSVSLLVLFRSPCLALLPRSAAGAEAWARPRTCRITVVLPFPGWTFRCPSWVVLVFRLLLLRFLDLPSCLWFLFPSLSPSALLVSLC